MNVIDCLYSAVVLQLPEPLDNGSVCYNVSVKYSNTKYTIGNIIYILLRFNSQAMEEPLCSCTKYIVQRKVYFMVTPGAGVFGGYTSD